MQSTTNQVRQVLMNELGLTRESVREITEQIIQKTVDDHVMKIIENSFLEKLIDKSVIKALQLGEHDRESMKSLILNAAGEAFKTEIRRKMGK